MNKQTYTLEIETADEIQDAIQKISFALHSEGFINHKILLQSHDKGDFTLDRDGNVVCVKSG